MKFDRKLLAALIAVFIQLALVPVMWGDYHYVAEDNDTPAYPYTSWDTAATQIQDAVDAATDLDFVLVSDGIYTTGGRTAPRNDLNNRVMVDKPITVISVSGPENTVIVGQNSVSNEPSRGVYLTKGAALVGFTITDGSTLEKYSTDSYGGGIYCEDKRSTIANCIITGNSSGQRNVDGFGGGVYGGTFYNCLINSNSSTYGCGASHCTLYNCVLSDNVGRNCGYGGGACECDLYNCLITSNSQRWGYGGGVSACNIFNCTVVNNSAHRGGGIDYGVKAINCIIWDNKTLSGEDQNWEESMFTNKLSFTCTTPMHFGEGNMTNDPQFVNAAAGDYRLSSNSPCINAGTNLFWMTDAIKIDLAGKPRIIDGIVDMGAYEYARE